MITRWEDDETIARLCSQDGEIIALKNKLHFIAEKALDESSWQVVPVDLPPEVEGAMFALGWNHPDEFWEQVLPILKAHNAELRGRPLADGPA